MYSCSMATHVKLKAEINLCFCVSLRKLIHSFILPSLLRIFLNMGSGKKTDVLYHIYNINYQQPQNVCSVYKTKKPEKCEKINLIVHRFNSQKVITMYGHSADTHKNNIVLTVNLIPSLTRAEWK